MARDVRPLMVLGASDHVVVVGAGFAGWRFVEALRRDGYAGALTLIGDERHAPYDRPPLSKQVVLGKWDVDRTTLATPELIAKNEVILRLGVPAASLDVGATTVHLHDGTAVVGTHVVVATGARARRLPYSADSAVHTVRGRDDVVRLLADLERLDARSPVAVIGGGFVGAEVATQLHSRGLRPIVLEAAARPLIGVVGDTASLWLANLASDAGIELRGAVEVRDVHHHGAGLTISFAEGPALDVGAVVLSVGAELNVEWLATSGLTIENGVVVDEHLMATDRVGAIGDVARFRWRSVVGDELVRVEHWEVANVHAAMLARYLVSGEASEALLVPYFWSDQYGKKIQMLGHPRVTDDVVRVSGSPTDGQWVALFSRGGVVSGLLALSQPRALMRSKHLLESPATVERALAEAPWAG